MEEYVCGIGGKDVAERMTLSGSNVDSIKEIGNGSINGVVLGKIKDVRPHPDADSLSICVADIGAEGEIQIITAAQNVKIGDYVPVARHGALLSDGMRIKKGKLRGEVSDGMLCSARELGFDDKVVPLAYKDGIWILPEEVRNEEMLGQDIFEVLGLTNTQVINFEITPNRPDCLAVYGLAAEYAAVYGLQLVPVQTMDSSGENYIKVSIAKPELCSRYIARIAENVEIKESPWWIQKRLMLSGMRPINNIVDITNYVMLELGNPIHAFDIREVSGGIINVDTASAGESFITLDGTERILDEDTLMIKDGSRSVAIAGIMGGLNSEVTQDTKTILIEAAAFSADSVRKTSKRLGIRTEASSRFEKGVPAELSKIAADRVCQLIKLTGAGTALEGAADCYPALQQEVNISVRPERVNAVLGTMISSEEMASILSRLGIAAAISEDGNLKVTPPITRLDLLEEIDVIEEVARIYGYDKLESTIPSEACEAVVSKSWAMRGVLRELLIGFGLTEIHTYSFTSVSGVERINAEEDADKNAFVKLINPLGEENSVMRTTLIPGLLEALAHNYSHSAKKCQLFEIGNIFRNYINDEGLPAESLSLCAGVYGEGLDFYYLKGVIEQVFKKFGIGENIFEPTSDNPTFHPGRCARIKFGFVGELHPDVTARYGIEERVCCLEIDFDSLADAADMHRVYMPLPKYPAILRDIAMLVDNETPVGRLLEIIRSRGGRLLESADLFDVYRGMPVPDGKKSLAFSLVFRDMSKTLMDEEVQKVLSKILKGLEDEAGAALRDS